MKTLTEIFSDVRVDLNSDLLYGYSMGRGNLPLEVSIETFMNVRLDHGFKRTKPTLLTAPDANLKLSKTFSYGLTLQSHATKLGRLRVNSCPDAGRCVAVCVLNNGNGGFPVVQRSRDARTDFAVQHPIQFTRVLGHELGKAVRKHGEITFRPNVNSDVRWLDVIPELALLHGITCYGYTKHDDPVVLDQYVEAYSLNEKTGSILPAILVDKGVSIAAVTNRRKGAPVRQWARELLGIDVEVVDADYNDLWMLDAHRNGVPVIGDLSAKGKAQTLARIEKALPSRDGIALATGRFVQHVY